MVDNLVRKQAEQDQNWQVLVDWLSEQDVPTLESLSRELEMRMIGKRTRILTNPEAQVVGRLARLALTEAFLQYQRKHEAEM